MMPGIYAESAVSYRCGAIAYTNSAGAAVTGLPAGGALHATITAEPETETSAPLLFAMLLYRNGTLADAACDQKTVSGSTTFHAQLQIPDSIAGLSVVTVLWDSAVAMKPVCAASVFPGKQALLRDLKVNGTSIEGFAPNVMEYTYTVAVDETAKPVLEASAMDQGAKISYIGTNAFPGKTTVVVSSPDGSGKAVYTVNYKPAKAPAANARVLKPDGGEYGAFEVGTNLNTGDGGALTDPSRTPESGRLGSRVHWDRNYPLNVAVGYTNEVRGISDAYQYLLGGAYLMGTAAEDCRANSGYKTLVTLYRGTTLRVVTGSATECSGWELETNSAGHLLVRNNIDRVLSRMSSKHFEVPNSSAGLLVEIPLETMYAVNAAGNKVSDPALVLLEYDGYTTMPENEKEGEIPDPDDPEPPPPEEKNGADSVKVAKTENGIESILAGSPTAVGVLELYDPADPDKGSLILYDRQTNDDYKDYNKVKDVRSQLAPYIEGADYIGCAAQNDANNGYHRQSGGYETSFKLYEGAWVMAFCSSENVNTAAIMENDWTYNKADGDPWCRIRRAPGELSWAVDSLSHMMYKHFDGDKDGETVAVPREMFYPANGGPDSAGVSFIAIVYDKNLDDPAPAAGADSVIFPDFKDTPQDAENGWALYNYVLPGFTDRTYAPIKVTKNGKEYILGSRVRFNRNYVVNDTYPNDVVSVVPALSCLYGCDYIMCPADPGDKGGVQFKLYKDATIAVVSNSADVAAATADGWNGSRNQDGFVIAQDNETRPLHTLLTKHFEASPDGTQITISDNILKANGSHPSCYFVLIHYDEMGDFPEII